MRDATNAVKVAEAQTGEIATAERQLSEARKVKYTEATKYMRVNPNVAFSDVGAKFGFSEYIASKLWKAAGFPARPHGRKKGISPGKREHKA